MTPKVKIFENVIPDSSIQRDIELRFVATFGENRALQSCRKVIWITKQKKKLGLRGTSASSHFGKNGPIAPKIP